MARGRHRNSALHRVLIPASLGGSALLCAGAAWLVGGTAGDGDALVLRILTAGAAISAVTGALLLRQWDLVAGRQVARERAAKAGMVWQVEERQAELEESQELVGALEAKIRDKRADLGRLRSEHAELLRRYATAESERARALEGHRQLALETAAPAKALPAQATDHRTPAGAPSPLTYRKAQEALSQLTQHAARQRAAQQHGFEPARHAPPRQRPQQPAAVPPPQRNRGGFDFFGQSSTPKKPEDAHG